MMASSLSGSAGRREQVASDLSTLADSQCPSIEEKEHLQVYLRIRPFTTAESNNGELQDCVIIEPPHTVLLKPPSLSLLARLSVEKSLPQAAQRFQFSQVYGPETTQKELFQGTVRDLVKDSLEGGNSLVFTYGVSNAGKTFTFLGPDADAGILPRSLNVIFSSIGEQGFAGMSIKPHRCQEFTRLTGEQQADEALFKKTLFGQLKEIEKSNASLLNSTNKTLLEESSVLETAVLDKISLNVDTHTKFSVWVSFCEIYNENIHDLLEVVPSGASRRPALRLSQDVKGNTFIKDLRWVQVNSAEEAYKVMKLGKKNQSFSSTRLNQLSSRSHSIFSIRILRIEDIGTPRVQAVSELSLCDLAGSERCTKTQNKGERLKEAGNINTSLLILGKCINALRHNQQAKLLQHVPFRESKLTHYLQGFFCGRGKACMIVNINQCASMYDETLNVLKLSAVAQKVVVLSTRPIPITPQRSISEASFVISEAERKTLQNSRRRSSLIGWENSLEDLQEGEDDEYEEKSLMEDTIYPTESEEDNDENDEKVLISKRMHVGQVALLRQVQLQLKKERAENMLVEARVREEVSREFSKLFSEMQDDFSERLVREREILEERAERRLEIFKNLINKMATAGPSPDSQTTDHSPDTSAELAGIKYAANEYLSLCRARAQGERRDVVLEMNEQMSHTHGEADGVEDEEKRKNFSQLQETSQVSQLMNHLGALQTGTSPDSLGCSSLAEEEGKKGQLQEVLAALEKEKKGREDALAALEYQTMGKEEALASLEEERKAREDVLATLEELKRSKDEVFASLNQEKKAFEAERQAKLDAVAALDKAKKSREEILAAIGEERSGKEAAQTALEVQRKEVSRLVEEGNAVQQEVKDLTAKLGATELQVTSETQRAEEALVQVKVAQTRLDKFSKEIQEKASQICTLTHEVQTLKQEVQALSQPWEEASELNKNLAEEKEKNEIQHRQKVKLELELAQARDQLAHHQLISEQQLEQVTQKLIGQEAASKHQSEELRLKLQEQEEASQRQLEKLQSELEDQEQAFKEEVGQLRTKLLEHTQALEKQLQELNEKLREQEMVSQQQLKDLTQTLREEKESSGKLLDDLKHKLSEPQQPAELLKAQEELKRVNSELQAEAALLRAKVSDMGEKTEKLIEFQKKLQDKEAQVTSLQKSLQEAQEQRDEDEIQAVQEARHREVERRRELLAVAHEAIAQKDEELKKKAEEISRLKENANQEVERAKRLSLDLRRKEDDASDLREKLADYKKQIEQVQKEISTMREEERVLRQKLSDMEKARKQLQCDLASRDRTIQQLRVEPSSDTKSGQTLQLYQNACKDLEAKERVMEDMRLALIEQEETQSQMDQVLEEKLQLISELSSEVERLKRKLLQQDPGNDTHLQVNSPSHDLIVARQEAAQANESLRLCTEKHQAERKKWLEEKLSLINQAKEAEDKRNQDMRRFVEDRERYTRQQSQLESLLSQLSEKEQTMDNWRKERDTLVAALEVQLQKLLSSQAEKDKLIQQLRQNDTQLPQESGDCGVGVAEPQPLCGKKAEILRQKEELQAPAAKQDDVVTQAKTDESPATSVENPQSATVTRDTRASVSSQGSASCPSVLDSSEISTENGRTSRFPRPELEISFSPLQPNRMALRRQGEENTVTVKITHSTRKRKSGEMDKWSMSTAPTPLPGLCATPSGQPCSQHLADEVEAQNRRNTRTKLTPKLTPHKEEMSSVAGRHDSQSRKDGTLQKIGEFLQSSPTLLGTKAKKMMSLVSGRSEAEPAASSSSSLSLSLRAKKSKRKLYRPEISSPMDMPSHPMISLEPEEKESNHLNIKRRLRSRMEK